MGPLGHSTTPHWNWIPWRYSGFFLGEILYVHLIFFFFASYILHFKKIYKTWTCLDTTESQSISFLHISICTAICMIGILIWSTYPKSTLNERIKPFIHHLVVNYDEIYWDDRLDLYKHPPYFGRNVTGMVDTMPIYVQQLTNSFLSRLLFNPKYGSHVYKIQLGFDFLGCIVLFSGPHLWIQYNGGITFSFFCFCILFNKYNISRNSQRINYVLLTC